ncbi:MAG: right-handed parallel beta-helix repeat-containing protein [Thermomicrobiales bacterium]
MPIRSERSRKLKLTRRTVLGAAGGSMLAAGTASGEQPLSQWSRLAGAQSSKATFVSAADFDLVGDGKTDDAASLQAAIDFAAEQGLRLVIPAGTYAVAKSIEIRSGSIVFANGVTLVTFIPDLGNPGTSFPTVRVYDAENVEIHGLEIEGRKDDFAHSQWKHGFAINNSRNVWLYQCRANRCKGDGVILENKNIGDVCIDIHVEACSFGQNYRMGGTASGALRARFVNCVFWGTVGTKPMCGFDVEPDRPDVTCQDISFFGCDFSDNGIVGVNEGYGFNVSFQPGATGKQSGVYLENCTFARNSASGIDLYRVPKDVRLKDCQVVDNAQEGIRIVADASDIAIEGGKIAANGYHGISCATEPDAPCQRLVIDSVEIVDNGWSDAGAWNGIHLDNLVDDISVSGCRITGSSGYGLYVAPTVANLQSTANDFVDNARGSTFPAMGLEDPRG